MVATTNPRFSGQFLAPVLGATLLSAALAGCQQPTASTNAGTPNIAAVATSDPVMLSSAAYTTGSISADGGSAVQPATAAAPAASALAPAPESAPPAMQAPPPQTTVAATPLPPPSEPVTLQSAPPPQSVPAESAPPVAAVRPDGYPNINVAPQEPGGQLLTPEERAKLIAELNALATRDTGGQ